MSDLAMSDLTRNTLIIMAPLEQIVLPLHLDGSQGQHRVKDKTCLIAARHDIEAIGAWLAEYAKSKKTYRNYQKEAERFLLWAVIERHTPLSSITAEDLLAYSDFLNDPQPAERWCGPKLARRGQRYSHAWKPFVGKLTPASKVTTFASLNSLFKYLYEVRYLDHNPIVSVRRQIKHHTQLDEYKWKLQERIIDIDEWETILAILNTLPNHTAEEQFETARLRFLFALLYFSGLRIDELVSNGMRAFVKQYHYEAQKDYWWLDVVGKGSKRRRIPVNQTLLSELIAYRRILKLPDLPQPHEAEPLIKSQLTQKGITDRRVNQLIKTVVHRAAKFYDSVDVKKAQRLRKFSAHWLRHLSVTMQGKAGIAKHHIKDNVGHEKWQTTEGYFHSFDYDRHQDMEKHAWLPKKLKIPR